MGVSTMKKEIASWLYAANTFCGGIIEFNKER